MGINKGPKYVVVEIEGKEIGIYYNPDDPTKVIAASKTFPIVMFCMGVISILIGIVSFFRGLSAMP